jgi:hypothetical protein
MNKLGLSLFIFFIVLCLNAFSQEVLVPISANPVIENQSTKGRSLSAKKTLEHLMLPFFDDFHYYDSSIYPDEKLWLDKNVYINSTNGDSTLTIGMASFDALDKDGKLYQAGLTETNFVADVLTSDTMDLSSYTPSDNVWISFYCQAGGFSEFPDKNDTLILQFYKPLQKTWVTVWDTTVNQKLSTSFKLVFKAVDDTSFLKDGFQFRFFNYVSVNLANTPVGKASNSDIWNIDNVYLNSERSATDSFYYDLAIAKPMPSLLKRFESIPWRHFKSSKVYQNAITGTLKITISNFSQMTLPVIRKFTITDVLKNIEYQPFSSESGNEVKKIGTFKEILEQPLISDENAPRAIFKIKGMIADNTLDIHPENDTTVLYQVFDNYYAYDDGSAEFGYGLEGESTETAQVAYKFEMYQPDSLQQVAMFFNRTYDNGNKVPFRLMVWDDNNGLPGKVLFDKSTYKGSPYFSPDTSQTGFNKFYNYRLDTPIYVPETFYIGWRQTREVFMNVGFDKNNLAGLDKTDSVGFSTCLFYNLQGIPKGWIPSKVKGALMMRPIVGPIANTVNTSVKTKELGKLQVYPNPVANRLYINLPSNEQQSGTSVQFFDITGKIMLNEPLNSGYVDVSALKPGLYLIKVTNSNGNIFVGKVIKNLR